MKKYIYGLITIISLMFCVQQTSAETIKMVYFELPPHQYTDDAGKVKGSYIAYFEAIASKMGYDVEWVGPLPILRMVDTLQNDKTFDGAIGFPKYPKFEAFLYYADTYVHLLQPILIVRKENPLTQIRTIDDVRGYTIGVLGAASGKYSPLIDNNLDAITLEELMGDMYLEQNFKKLLSGRVDALFDRQSYTLPFIAAKLNVASQIKVLVLPDPANPTYVVFSKASKRGKKLLDQYNALVPQVSIDYEELVQHEMEAVTQQQ